MYKKYFLCLYYRRKPMQRKGSSKTNRDREGDRDDRSFGLSDRASRRAGTESSLIKQDRNTTHFCFLKLSYFSKHL